MLLFSVFSLVSSRPSFTYNNSSFLLNGDPYQIIGGQMDPQRIPRPYWRQRLQMARAMGLNTVFSYVFWNNIEPRPGQWNFEDRNDVAEFFRLAQEEGLHVVLRPGPYICGEHEYGGFPAWLSQIPGMAVRQNNGPFLARSKRYLDRLGQELRGLQITNGGPIIMVQLENEYGFFRRNDTQYLSALATLLRDNFDLFLYTNDGGEVSALGTGQLHGVLSETDGDPKIGFAARDKAVTDPTSLGPQLDGEYYVTTANKWGSNSTHTTASGDPSATAKILSDLDWVLAGNNSLAIYMFHGGTNWGLENGAIGSDYFNTNPFTTSYDFGAPLDESGRPTEIYYQIRQLISKYVPEGSIPDVPSTPSLAEVPQFALRPVLGLLENLRDEKKTTAPYPLSMEALNQNYGFVLYEHTVTTEVEGTISPGGLPRDRVIVFVNGGRVGVIDALYNPPASAQVSLQNGDLLQLLVEDLGRQDIGTDAGKELYDQVKGIVGNVTVGNSTALEGWSMHSIPLDTLPSAVNAAKDIYAVQVDGSPVFYKGSFQISQPTKAGLSSDTFLTLPHGTKGVVWVNGHMLGRYWAIGPQQSLYVPGCYLKGRYAHNEVVVLELEPQPGTPFTAQGIPVRNWFNNPDPDAP